MDEWANGRRFHKVSEFDDSKRSCRRRLAGHNERRRKSSHDSASRNSAQVLKTALADVNRAFPRWLYVSGKINFAFEKPVEITGVLETQIKSKKAERVTLFPTDNKLIMTGRFPYLSSPTGRALSLLSSRADSWISPSDISSRSSAALRELIAENRAASLARQLILYRDWHLHHHAMEDVGEAHPGSSSIAVQQHPSLAEPHGWDRFPETGAQVTLDLMQASSPAFGMLSVRGKSREEEEECSALWNSSEGTHLV
ncbi:hypothetical protein CRYUN_Cryun01aG0247200 [Craigia yunnanensis]